MKVFVFALTIAAIYGLILLSATNVALGSVQKYQSLNGHVAATSDQWSRGDTSASFVADR